MNQAQITESVCATLGELRTQLVLVDDIHLLDTRTRSGRPGQPAFQRLLPGPGVDPPVMDLLDPGGHAHAITFRVR
ncbi:hypothetical protein [Streptomyces olivochromogenes]|nr:hypothetical protein [Streptomyces olivochromogenes]